jgi:hypothetical protein
MRTTENVFPDQGMTLAAIDCVVIPLVVKAERIWVMDRGIPTEEVLARMRQSDPPGAVPTDLITERKAVGG